MSQVRCLSVFADARLTPSNAAVELHDWQSAAHRTDKVRYRAVAIRCLRKKYWIIC